MKSLRFGRYQTLRPIASGGMATVHLGRALGVGGFERLVAIKVMHPHIADEPSFVTMFLDEARMAAGIRHPNVVATIDLQQSDDGLFLVMEYVEGPSLRVMLRKLASTDQRAPLDVTVRIFSDVLAGLQSAHELVGKDGQPQQLVHRDVSPANILVGADGITRLTDFGVARARARLTTTEEGRVKGKVAYMPPEQLLAEPLDRRADIYAAGISLWETLAGKRLITGDDEAAMLRAIMQGATHAPREIVADLPEQISSVCMKALEPDREARFATAAAFAEALESAAADAGVAVATSRRLASFIEGLGAHERVDPTTLLTDTVATRVGPTATESDQAGPPETANAMSAARSTAGHGSRRWSFAAGVVTAAVLATVLFLALWSRTGPTESVESQAAPAESLGAASAASGSSAAASSATSASVASASHTATPDASAPAHPPTGHHPVRPPTTRATRTAPPAKAPPQPSASDYNPRSL